MSPLFAPLRACVEMRCSSLRVFALARGYKLLRAAGDAGWVSGTQESKDFIDYELKVNAALAATKVAAVCTYRADVTADELVAIVTAHQNALNAAA
jgi:hypothetical protein